MRLIARRWHRGAPGSSDEKLKTPASSADKQFKMGSTGSLTFPGISSYSSDLQTILQRAVSIAQLPVKSLQNHQTDNLNKKAALVALNPAVANLGAAVAALGSLAANGGGLVA